MRRRSFGRGLLIGVLAGASLAAGEPAKAPATVGVLCVGDCPAPPLEVSLTTFLNALRETGYGPSRDEMHRLAATVVAKILQGKRPADIPVEQPTRYELVVNLATAKAIGVTIPPAVLARADEVIQ